MKKPVLIAMVMVGILVWGNVSHAEFPNRNIRWIVTYSPGGGFDTMSRGVARSMKKYLPPGVNVVIKNITGAGGRTGAVSLYRSKPDGHTIGILDILGLTSAQMIWGQKKTIYDLGKLIYLARVANEPYTLLVAGKSRYKTLKDLQNVSRLTWGSEGIGSGRWLPSFLAAKNLKLGFHVVGGYRGTGESLPGLIRGDFKVWINPSDHPSVIPVLKTGDVRCVVHLGVTRGAACPDTPTPKELGYDFALEILRLVAAPPGTPPERVKIMESLLVKAMADEGFIKWTKKSGSMVNPGDGAAARKSLNNLLTMAKRERAAMKKALAK